MNMTLSVKTVESPKGLIKVFTLSNTKGTQVDVTNLGATITRFLTKDKKGQLRDIVLGYDPIEAYFKNTNTYFGATVGRSANRLAGARFTLNENQFQIPQNEGENNLHSGPNGYQIRLWDVASYQESDSAISFMLNSPDGDQGYPGNLAITVGFKLSEDNELLITYKGVSDKDTLFNVTNHSYFNLNGHESGSIEKHSLQLLADAFTPIVDSHSIPSGEIRPVDGSAFDFRKPKEIGKDISSKDQQLHFAGGYDHNWVLNTPSMEEPFAIAVGDTSGIKLEAYTTLPGVQFYSGNFLDGDMGKDHHHYQKRQGFCLETQYFPNAINIEGFASPLLKAGQEICTQTKYKVSIVS
ncbi:aldose epimerase [Streptococcus iniae]|nr:aldose epimerase [Streptococcus iniae]